MTSFREKEKTVHTISFQLGKKVLDEKRPLTKKDKKHGMYTKMIPSKKFLGATAHLPVDTIETWVEKISYFIADHVKIHFEIREGLKVITKRKFEKRDPIGLLEDICSDEIIIKPIHFVRSDEFDEEVINTDSKIDAPTVIKHRRATYGVMIAYDDSLDPCYDSYCNFANTTEGGVHVDAAEKAFCNYIQKAIKDSMTDKEKEKIDILWNDIRQGLKMVVYLNTNANVQFEGNVKEKINAKILTPIMSAGISEEIVKYFEENPDKLKAIVKLVKGNAKARIEANKVRVATAKETMTSIKEQQIPNYDRALNTGKNDYREIFIVEGDSAKGSASRRRDPNFQAFFAVRGMTANPYNKSLVQMMDPESGNKEWRTFVQVLRCGIGKNFDLSKLYFNKIIILTDADIDGSGITSAIAAFFMKCLPQVVEAGYLYKALPPLYKIKDGNKEKFVHDKEEYVDLYLDKVVKNYEIAILAHGKEFINKKDFKEFLFDTESYLRDLSSVSNHYRISKFLIERVASFLVWKYPTIDSTFDIGERLKDQKFVTELMATIQKLYPEIKFNDKDCALFGVAEGHFGSIELNSKFMRKITPLLDTYKKYGYTLLVKENNEPVKDLSIGMFTERYQKYIPKISQRFKGLGEMTPEDLYATTLDPYSRVLIQLTSEDLKKEMKVFDVLHGKKKKDKELRKKMMREYHIKPDDLDN